MDRTSKILSMMSRATRRVVGDYAHHLRALGRSPNTIEARTYWLLRLCQETGRTPAQQDAASIEAWLAAHDWSRATRRVVVTGLRQFYAWAGADPDPTAGLTAPRQPAYRARPIPDDALARGMAAASRQDWWMLRTFATTGLRRSELAAMRPRDVAGSWLTVRGKGGRVRRVPLPPDVAAYLASLSEPMWPDSNGRPLSGPAITVRCHTLTGHGPHAIRHRYATRAYAASHDLAAVQRLLGHASIATTQQYLAVGDDELVAAAGAAWAA